jgi:two-component system, chemotaxis family, chemotaxis protein CheY
MSQTANSPFSRLSILLVEDEAFAQRLAVSVLNQIGVKTVVVAKSGTEALTVLGQPTSKFDLIISDWQMPEMTGLNLLKKVRETWPEMPFIMLTGKTSGDFVLAAKDHGVNGYVAKPFAPAQLTAKIASVMRIKV